MSDIEPMTPEALSQYIGEYIGDEWAEYFERLQANLAHRDELYEAALVKIREYEDHILTLGSQLAALKRHEQNCGDDRDYWFKLTKELEAQLAAVTPERDELEVDLFNALDQLRSVRKEISDLRAYIAMYAKPLVTPND